MLKWLAIVLLLVSCAKKPALHYAVLDNATVQQHLTAYIQRNPIDHTKVYYLELTEQGDSTEVRMTSLSTLDVVEFVSPCDMVQIGSHQVLLTAPACAQNKPFDLEELSKQYALAPTLDRTTRSIAANGDTIISHNVTLYCPPTLRIKLYHNQVVRVR
ncbi:hypothetical protein [Hymenobacter sp. HDW8]|uniref:hypothetical protein n=1 Tax=Hymenobacter sp. HDW8 TaxID=2714932 RepID=UPI00140A3999|nr:hypothetical protein [Hymenobacter sp. HDW8]QIL78371.1 hypothetical protein G7064_21385 [Hymenobacter sp. HDW8]